MKKHLILFLLPIIIFFTTGCSYLNIVSAAKNQNLEQVKAHVEKGEDINQVRFGWTALQYGAFYGNLKIVKYLIENGANLDIQGSSGFTALHYAVYYGNFEIAKSLVEAGAKKDLEDNQGYTPFYYAKRYGSAEMSQLFRSEK